MIDFSLYNWELKQALSDAIIGMGKYRKTHKGYSFNCPHCNDKKGRGQLLLNKEPYMYYCHNSGCDYDNGIPAMSWLKDHHPTYYNGWIKEVIALNKESVEKKEERLKKRKAQLYQVERRVPKRKPGESRPDISDMKDFIARNTFILKHMDTIKNYPNALKWCADRKMPEHIYMKWLFVPAAAGTKFDNRIIIPFDNSEGKIYFFQARTIVGDEPKYKNALSDLRPIYNYYEADFTKPVIITEGPIDSMFIENAVALLGTKYMPELLDAIPQKYFIYDNDKAGRDQALIELEKGQYVFMWKKFIKNFAFQKSKVDFNDLVILTNKEKFTFEELQPYFTNNLFMKGLL
jgi:transcription elongation factor Elf1